ncbi:MAG: SpoIIE family protein phosphatase [Bacteroidetes bacterium]|nr:SpoIIE family protein phosphatase [Bacteroidota bacterium]
MADLLSVIFILMGLLFKTLHWPGGNYLVIAGTIILVITFIFWNISFRKEVKLRVITEEKLKETLSEVEEKQKEITDSINYAKRIQEAILPSFDFIKTHLPNSFIYYQPKDIVAGDFYWAEKVGKDFFIAAADCTGHGVPGALVSVVCCNALNRTVNEFKLTDPGKILDKTRELVLESFSKNGGDIKDGMDISLISINETTVKWAGANNPLWYIKSSVSSSGFENKEPVEIKASKQPIGKTDNPEPFTTHTIELQKGDSLYLFTDGFADQFGGPKGKKFKYKQLEDLLVSSKNLSINEQHLVLKKALNSWKGNLEQVDDICIIGIRV